MKEKITAFFKQHWPNAANAPLAVAAAVLAVALVVAFLSLWLAKITGVSDGFLRLVDSVLSPTVVFVGIIAGVFIWVVKTLTSELLNKFSGEIKGLINRIFKFAGADFHSQCPCRHRNLRQSILPQRRKQVRGQPEKKPASDSVTADKRESGAKSTMAKTAPASDSLDEVKSKAEAGDAEAQFNLGQMLRLGKDVERDDAEAVRLYRLAAEQRHAKAQFTLGWMYANGRGVDRDDAEAVKLYRLAVEQGHDGAHTNLGWMYENGRGVEQDNAEAVRLYRFAAEQGSAQAQRNLGVMYHNGKGVAQNYWEAYIWHSIAAANGIQSSVENRDMDAKLLLLSAEDLAKAQAEATRRMEEIRKRAESGK